MAAVIDLDRQTAKFNSPPNFPAIQYIHSPALLYIACTMSSVLMDRTDSVIEASKLVTIEVKSLS